MHEISKKYCELADELKELHLSKAADYGLTEDPLNNMRAAEDFNIPAVVGCMMRMNDKMKRLKAWANNGSLENEGLRDTFMDLAGYALIGILLLEEEHNNKPNKQEGEALRFSFKEWGGKEYYVAKKCWNGPCYAHRGHYWEDDKCVYYCEGASTDRT